MKEIKGISSINPVIFHTKHSNKYLLVTYVINRQKIKSITNATKIYTWNSEVLLKKKFENFSWKRKYNNMSNIIILVPYKLVRR